MISSNSTSFALSTRVHLSDAMALPEVRRVIYNGIRAHFFKNCNQLQLEQPTPNKVIAIGDDGRVIASAIGKTGCHLRKVGDRVFGVIDFTDTTDSSTFTVRVDVCIDQDASADIDEWAVRQREQKAAFIITAVGLIGLIAFYTAKAYL